MNEQQLIPLILGSGISAFGLIRSFSCKQILPLCIDDTKDIAAYSRFCKFFRYSSSECTDNLNKLIEWLAEKYGKFFIIPTTDIYVNYLIDKYYQISDKHVVAFRKPELIRKLLNKHLLYEYAGSFGLPTPTTMVVKDLGVFEIEQCGIGFPLILKPTVNYGFKKITGNKVLIIKDVKEFRYYQNLILSSFLRNDTFVIQNYIEGDITGLYTCTSYSDENGVLLAYSVGHKIRQFPRNNGTIISGRVKPCHEVLELTRQFYLKIGFSGFANIEYKYCSADGKYYLMEINPRPGFWNYSASFSGINIAYSGWLHACGKPIVKQLNTREIVWGLFLLDFFEAVISGNNCQKFNLIEWAKSIKGPKVSGTFSFRDPLVSIIFLFKKLFG